MYSLKEMPVIKILLNILKLNFRLMIGFGQMGHIYGLFCHFLFRFLS